MGRVAIRLLVGPVFVAATVWGAAAISIDGPDSPLLAYSAATAFVLSAIACRFAIRPIERSAVIFSVLLTALLGWWLSISPSSEREWQPDVARSPTAHFHRDGNRVTVRNVRNFHYRSETDYDELWEERSYDLSKLRGMDMFLSYWGSPHMAHTVASWEFENDEHLAISIETRKERGESYSAVLGFFRQFELYYVVADERDVIRLRTDYRAEDVYLYRLRLTADQARQLLVDYLDEVNHLAREPVWYNALTHNCTTTIRLHMQHVGIHNPLRWQLFANGHLDELAYARGQIDTSLPFEQIRARSYISPVARAMSESEDYSTGIRRNLPDPRPVTVLEQ